MGTGLADRLGELGGTGMFNRGSAEAEARAEEPKAEKPERRVNVYAGECRHCGQRVEAKAGYLERANGRWEVEHAVCPQPQMIEHDSETGAENIRTADDYKHPVWPGIYTVINPEAPSGHRTFKVELQPADADFAPDDLIIGLLVGSNNESDYENFGFVNRKSIGVWKKWRNRHDAETARSILADAAKIYDYSGDTDEITLAKACLRCGATLTRPDSIELGMGPTCRNKGW
jgi:hypothetical protein